MNNKFISRFRVKFFGGWIIAEGICIACNLGTVEKEDGTVDYSSIVNIDIYNVSIKPVNRFL